MKGTLRVMFLVNLEERSTSLTGKLMKPMKREGLEKSRKERKRKEKNNSWVIII